MPPKTTAGSSHALFVSIALAWAWQSGVLPSCAARWHSFLEPEFGSFPSQYPSPCKHHVGKTQSSSNAAWCRVMSLSAFDTVSAGVGAGSGVCEICTFCANRPGLLGVCDILASPLDASTIFLGIYWLLSYLCRCRVSRWFIFCRC